MVACVFYNTFRVAEHLHMPSLFILRRWRSRTHTSCGHIWTCCCRCCLSLIHGRPTGFITHSKVKEHTYVTFEHITEPIKETCLLTEAEIFIPNAVCASEIGQVVDIFVSNFIVQFSMIHQVHLRHVSLNNGLVLFYLITLLNGEKGNKFSGALFRGSILFLK